MTRLRRAALTGAMLTTGALASVPAWALDVGGAISNVEGAFDSATQQVDRTREEIKREQAGKAAERERTRDRSKDVCYSFEAGSDIQTACLNEYPMAVRNERARNILLGYCSSLGSSDFSSELSYVCREGAGGCSALSNGDAAYWCKQCAATRPWLAVYSLGSIIQCFK